MTCRSEDQWSAAFVNWIETTPYQKAFLEDRKRPTYTSDFFRWSLAEEAFNEGRRFQKKLEPEKTIAEQLMQKLVDQKIENYMGCDFVMTVDGEVPFNLTVTTQLVDKPTAHELRVAADERAQQMQLEMVATTLMLQTIVNLIESKSEIHPQILVVANETIERVKDIK